MKSPSRSPEHPWATWPEHPWPPAPAHCEQMSHELERVFAELLLRARVDVVP